MVFPTRVFSAGKLLLLVVGLFVTFVVFAATSARIALRAREVRVPDVHGRTLNDASAALAGVGLGLTVDEARRPDPAVPAGCVVVQHPQAGATARRGRNVRVWVSEGARADRVPLLTGETERNAQLRIEQDHLTLAVSSEIRASDYPAGMVVGQDPPAGSGGSRVSVLVNRGEQGARYVMPDLIGTVGARAADLMRRRGFRVTVVGHQLYPGIAAGIVLRQSPEGGFQIAPGEPISLEVSR